MQPNYFQEITRKFLFIAKNEEIQMSWCNNVLSVRTEKGINLLEFSYNLQCWDRNIDCLETIILTPKSSPATNLFTKKIFKNGMSNIDYTEMILDPSFWPHNSQLLQETANISNFKWSPPIYGNEHIIATLNNVGNVNIFIPKRYRWENALNLSSIVENRFMSNLKNSPRSLEELRIAVYTVETSAICWGPVIDKKSCYFITSQKNGNILFWSIHCHGTEIKSELIGEFQSNTCEIISIWCIPKMDNKFVLLCGNIIGQFLALECHIDNGIKFNSKFIWEHKDRMIINYLEYDIVNDKIILIYNKYRHLIVQILDDNCNVVSQSITNVNDYKIAVITKCKEGFFLGTVNCKMYQLNISYNNKDIIVALNLIKTKENYSTYELCSFCFSSNSVMFVAGLVDRKMLCRKEPTFVEIIFFCTDSNSKREIMLLNNPTKKLTYFWDCVEYLRYKTMKQKCLPALDYNQLYIDAGTDIYKLKIYLIFAILYDNMEKIVRNGSKGLLPETSLELIRDKILAQHCNNVLSKLHKSFKENKMLTNFESESLAGTNMYLQHYCKKYKKQLSEFIPSNTIKFLASDFVAKYKSYEYICQCCDEKLEGLSCKDGHPNMFCSLSFTPIESDIYLICKNCNCTARIELKDDEPICVFCDLYMSNIYVPL